MTISERFDVVAVPFPFADPQARLRPALVLSDQAFRDASQCTVLAMITTAGHSRWPTDVAIADLAAAGLPAPSVVRFKVWTLELGLVARRLGRLADSDRFAVERAWLACLGLWSE